MTVTPWALLQTTERTEVSSQSVLGEMEVNHPLIMSPGAGDVVILSIHMPPLLASLDPISIERVEIPVDAPRVLGKQNTHRVVILIAQTMRVELVGKAFDPVAHYPAVQKVNVVTPLQRTLWAWDITAPTVLGQHFLTVRVYQEEQQAPTYVGSFQIDVVAFTPTPLPSPTPTGTPTPTPTPLPALRQMADDLMENSATVVAALIGLLGTLLTVTVSYLAIRKKQGKADVYTAPGDEQAYNIAAIRKLLYAAFTAETLRRFCIDHPPFQRILRRFGPEHGLDDMIDEVIDFCTKKNLWKEFLVEVAKENQGQYARFESDIYIAGPGKSTSPRINRSE